MVDAGSCNGCELELNATANVNFDLQRYGIEWVASPRHADALVLSGTLTCTMTDAVRLAWEAMPEPRFVVAVGACAISGGLYDGARGVERGFLDDVIPALYVRRSIVRGIESSPNAEFGPSRSPKPADGDHRNRRMAITETGHGDRRNRASRSPKPVMAIA